MTQKNGVVIFLFAGNLEMCSGLLRSADLLKSFKMKPSERNKLQGAHKTSSEPNLCQP